MSPQYMISQQSQIRVAAESPRSWRYIRRHGVVHGTLWVTSRRSQQHSNSKLANIFDYFIETLLVMIELIRDDRSEAAIMLR